jgi:hypothetical protein
MVARSRVPLRLPTFVGHASGRGGGRRGNGPRRGCEAVLGRIDPGHREQTVHGLTRLPTGLVNTVGSSSHHADQRAEFWEKGTASRGSQASAQVFEGVVPCAAWRCGWPGGETLVDADTCHERWRSGAERQPRVQHRPWTDAG